MLSKKPRTKKLRTAAFMLAFLACAAAANAGDSRKIRIGFLIDTAGPGAFYGVPSMMGARLAQEDLRKSGEEIEILFEETETKALKALSAAAHLLDVEKVDAIVSDLTQVSVPIAPKVAAAGIVQIYHSPARSIEAQFPSAFRNFMDYREGCRALVSQWKNEKKRIAVLAPNLEFGELCSQGALQADSDILVFRYNAGDDLRTPVTKIAADKRDAVLHVGMEPDFLAFFQHCRNQHFRPEHGFVEIMLTKPVVTEAGGDLEGARVIAFQESPKDLADRLSALDKRAENHAIAPAAVAYNGVMSVAKALRACGPRERDCVVSELRKAPASALIGFRGWSEEMRYPVVLRRYRSAKLVGEDSTS